MRRTLVIVMAVLMVTVGTGYAGSVGTLTTFTPNTPAHAESVNDNFTAVETAVNDNAADITTNADGISSNADSITDVKNQLGNKLDKPTCTDGQVLKYSSGVWVCAEDLDTINTNADLLDGLDSYDFAYSIHSHDVIVPGVFPISAAAFNGPLIEHGMQGRILRSSSPGGGWGWAGFTLPFRCTIVGMEAQIRNQSATEEVYVELHDGELLNANSDTQIPIVSLDTSSQAPSSKYIVFSTPPLNYDYDPANLEYLPLWVAVKFANYASTGQKMHWVKVYYVVP